jgi:DEAD/DEAH box helicase domain-containing protein
MRKIVFDIETKNIFSDVGSNDASKLDLSLIGVYDYETDTYTSYLEEELSKLWPLLEKADMLIGYNSDHFDIPLLNKYYPGDLTKIKSMDLLREIRTASGRRMSLDQVAEATLGKKKIAHGLQAVTWWKQGDIESIRKYCLEDVKITKEVYEFAKANNKIFFQEGGKRNEVRLDASTWDEKDDSAITFSLPF